MLSFEQDWESITRGARLFFRVLYAFDFLQALHRVDSAKPVECQIFDRLVRDHRTANHLYSVAVFFRRILFRLNRLGAFLLTRRANEIMACTHNERHRNPDERPGGEKVEEPTLRRISSSPDKRLTFDSRQ